MHFTKTIVALFSLAVAASSSAIPVEDIKIEARNGSPAPACAPYQDSQLQCCTSTEKVLGLLGIPVVVGVACVLSDIASCNSQQVACCTEAPSVSVINLQCLNIEA